MSIAESTQKHLAPLLNTYRPASEQDYTEVLSTREVLTLIFDSTLDDALDGEAIETMMVEAGFVKLANGSGEFWLVREFASHP
jgi:hypothetical protein